MTSVGVRIPWRRILSVAAPTFVVAYFLWRVRDILPPFLIALFTAALLDPAVCRLTRKGVSRARAVASLFALAGAVVLLGAFLVLPSAIAQVTELGANISVYADNLSVSSRKLTDRADGWYGEHARTLGMLGLSEKPSVFVARQSGPLSNSVQQALTGVRDAVIGLLGQVLWLIIIPVSLFYFLLEYPAIRSRALVMAPTSRRAQMDRVIQDVLNIFGAYVRGLAKVCVLYAATAAILFWILRVPYALFLGLAAGTFYAVPYVGPAMSVLSVVFIALTTGKALGATLLVVGLFIVMHVSFDYGVTPRVVGGSVGLHPLVNIFAIMCGVTLFGVWGMILAVPVAASVQKTLVQLAPRYFASADPSEDVAEDPSPS